MRLNCPLCGARDRREFYYYGSEDYLNRPAPDALPQAWDDYLHWHSTDPKLTKRIHLLIKEARRTPFEGVGKPEALRHALSGFWSRRINDEHRMVYKS